MFQAVRCAASSFLFLLAVAGNATAQSNYQVVSLSRPGTIAGAVKWSGPLPRVPTFTINKDPEICDPESHKIRDLERLIVGPQGLLERDSRARRGQLAYRLTPRGQERLAYLRERPL